MSGVLVLVGVQSSGILWSGVRRKIQIRSQWRMRGGIGDSRGPSAGRRTCGRRASLGEWNLRVQVSQG